MRVRFFSKWSLLELRVSGGRKYSRLSVTSRSCVGREMSFRSEFVFSVYELCKKGRLRSSGRMLNKATDRDFRPG